MCYRLDRGPVLKSPTATAHQQQTMPRRIEASAMAQVNQEASAGSTTQSTVVVTRRLPGVGWRTSRQSPVTQGNLAQDASQSQQVQTLGTSQRTAEPTTRDRRIIEICRHEDNQVQERLVSLIEQAVLQPSN